MDLAHGFGLKGRRWEGIREVVVSGQIWILVGIKEWSEFLERSLQNFGEASWLCTIVNGVEVSW